MATASSSGSGSPSYSLRASSATSHGKVAAPPAATKLKCGTKIGRALPTPDGIISWNDTSGTAYDTAGGADFVCKKRTLIKRVQVFGFGGSAPTDTFNVTFYRDDGGVATRETDSYE